MSKAVTTAKLMEDLQTVVRDVEALLRETATQTGEKVQEVRARAQESLRNAKARLSEVQDAVVERTQEAAESADTYVRKNPWQSVGVAAGVGLLIGLLLSRRD